MAALALQEGGTIEALKQEGRIGYPQHMILIDSWKRRFRIRELRKAITAPSRKYDLKTEARLQATRIPHKELNELNRLLQLPLLRSAERWGFDIPAEYWDHGDLWSEPTLTEPGKNWIRRETSKRRREWAKDWVSILSPFLSAVIAILGLLVALMKH